LDLSPTEIILFLSVTFSQTSVDKRKNVDIEEREESSSCLTTEKIE